MNRPKTIVSLAAIVLLFGSGASAGAAPTGKGPSPKPAIVVRLSVAADGQQANAVTENSADFSPRGTAVAFDSYASNLVSDDSTGFDDVFVKDLSSGQVQLVSRNSEGAQGDGHSQQPDYSPDGQRLTFYSEASNLVPGDTNQRGDIFVSDLSSGTISRVSISVDGGEANGLSRWPAFSPDGMRIAFYSDASNLAADDTNGATDLFVKDLTDGSLQIVSRSATGELGDQASGTGGVQIGFSPDGTQLAFDSNASNLVPDDTNGHRDVFVKNLVTGAIVRANTAATGSQSGADARWPVFAPDGRRAAFSSSAADLVPGSDVGNDQVFIKDLTTGAVELVSSDAQGTVADGSSYPGSFTPDGTRLTFFSWASNLVANDTNAACDIFVKNLRKGSVERLSVTSSGGQSDNGSFLPVVSPDGKKVAFNSLATNLVEGDTNGVTDLYLRTLK